MATQKGYPFNTKPFSLDSHMTAEDMLSALGQEMRNGFTALASIVQSNRGGSSGSGSAVSGVSSSQIGAVEEIALHWQVNGIQTPVPPLTSVMIWDSRSYPYLILKVVRHWPAGCMGLVDMQISASNNPFLPAEGFVALDDALLVQEFSSTPIYVKGGLPVALIIQNTDSIFAHGPSATITIAEVK